MNKVKFKQLRDRLKRYSPKDLFLWIQVTAVYPSNQIYQLRFEFLLAVFFSIPSQEFAGRNLDRNEFIDLVVYYEKEWGDHFYITEDWTPFSQKKRIPFFSNKKKFYFFYGLHERPYEYLRQLEDLYFSNTCIDNFQELVLLRKVFYLSLEFQTNLLNKISKLDYIDEDTASICIPSEIEYIELVQIYKTSNDSKDILRSFGMLEFGVFQKHGSHLFDLCLRQKLFNTLYVQFSENETFFLLPQLHMGILYLIGSDLINKSHQRNAIAQNLFESFQTRLKKKCLQFFACNTEITEVLQQGTESNLTENVDFVARVDADKLILIKAVQCCDTNTPCLMEGVLREIHLLVEKLQKELILGLKCMTGEIVAVPSQVMEVWVFIVFECNTIEYRYELNKKEIGKKDWIVNNMDFNAILEFIEKPTSLLKFLRADFELRSKSNVRTTDFLDRFVYYFSSGESYPIMGIKPTMMMFAPHEWHDFFHEHIFTKYQDDIYERIEYEYHGYFNYIKQDAENIYEVLDTGTLSGGKIVKFGKGLIWIIYPPDGYYLSYDLVVTYSGLIGPLFADYINRLRISLQKLFEQLGAGIIVKYQIGIYPAPLIMNIAELDQFVPYAKKINKETPLIIETMIDGKSRDFFSILIYDPVFLQDLFAQKDNAGEKYCIQQLVKSLYLAFNPNMTEQLANNFAQEFVNNNIPNALKGYSYDAIPAENPKLDLYDEPILLSKPEIAKVNLEVVEFLASENIVPREYHGEDAKKINNLIFQFIGNRLREELNTYNQSVLFFAYEQIEFIEGKRDWNRKMLAINSNKYIEFDIVQREMDNSLEISKLSVASKIIIESILTTSFKGNKAITKEGWQYLLAISVVLFDTSVMSDNIHYGIVPHGLQITELYEVKSVLGESAINSEKYFLVENERKVGQAKTNNFNQNVKVDTDLEDGNNIKPMPSMLREIDATFRTLFGFSYDNLVMVLYTLGHTNFEKSHYFPLTTIDEDKLVSLVMEFIKDPPEEKECKAILKFVSLDYDLYKKNIFIIPSKQLRSKDRINLCPLIKYEGKYIYGNQMCLAACDIWSHSIASADFPYELGDNHPLQKVIKILHRFLDESLECRAVNIAIKVLGKENVEGNIDNFKRLCQGFSSKPDCGEIDLIAINTDTKTLFLLEAKNRPRHLRPYDIRKEIDQFFNGPKSYLAKLLKKELFVKSNMPDVLTHFNVSDISGWQLKKAFIVNSNHPSAYTINSNIDFVIIDELNSFLLNG